MDVIDDLIKKREDLFKQVEAIDVVLKIYGYKGSDYKFDSNTKEMETSDTKIFPINARTDKQVLWLFQNSITKAIKLRGVQELYNKYKGNDSVKIDNVTRKLKTDKKLVIVKYNDKNILSYWGLPEWIDGGDFKTEYVPDADSLPDEILTTVVYTG